MDSTMSLSVANLAPPTQAPAQVVNQAPVEPPATKADPVKPAGPTGNGAAIDVHA